ncbi:MAG: PDZ domain-containing protein, partial [Phycisphaerae bacterium]
MRLIRSLVSLAWAFQTAGGFAFAQQTRPADQPVPAATLEAHVRQLGDYRYAVRNEATAALSSLKPVNLPQLLNYYLQEHRHEPKLRLRFAIEQVFYRQMMAGESGFLGIRLREFQVWDPRAGQVTASVVVDEVQPGMAAEKGGMRDLDIILDFGGQPVAALMNPAAAPKRKEEPLGAEQFARGFASPELLAFMNHVKQTRPGTPLPLRVLRAVETRKVRLPPGVTDTGGLALTQLPFPLDRMYVERAVV